jgi:hypothetical protein
MLRILALSGHDASFRGDDLHQISAKECKRVQRLRRTGHSPFQQLILDGFELKNNQTIEDMTLPKEITLVLRPLQHPPGNVELLDGVRRNGLCKIDKILKKPVGPDISEGKMPLNTLHVSWVWLKSHGFCWKLGSEPTKATLQRKPANGL